MSPNKNKCGNHYRTWVPLHSLTLYQSQSPTTLKKSKPSLSISKPYKYTPTLLFFLHTTHHNNQPKMLKLTITTVFLLLTTISGSNAHLETAMKYLSPAAQFLGPQNAARARVGERPLVWDPRLERYAKWYANQRRYDCALVHSNGPYGENIFWGSGTDWTPGQAAVDWLAEGRFYKHVSNSCAGGQVCGHYTQIVWKGTRRVGCARVTCAQGKGVFMTCNYDPPGNYYGEKPY